MSAIDRLRSFDSEWQEHLRWRAGEEHERGTAPDVPKGQYVQKPERFGDPMLKLSKLPSSVREAFMRDANLAIAAILDRIHDGERTKLAQEARAEANRVLEELQELAGEDVKLVVPR